MAGKYDGLVIVVPTRNRADLAIGAIQSVLSQNVDNVRILVSDNSTIAEEAASLLRSCRHSQDERLSYVVPPEPLPICRHWNWAMLQALRLGASHFTVLTDRMIFRPGDLKTLTDIVRQHPEKIISYKHDKIFDHERPITLFMNEWTGNVFEINSGRLLYLTSQAALHESLPRMLNCIVPRSVIDAIVSRFGSLVSSFAPDFNFCYRALAVEDSILLYDKGALIHRALNRSTGQNAARGIKAGGFADFLKDVDESQWLFAAPIPQLRTVLNTIVHEYCFVQKESSSPKFPEVDMDRYLPFFARELDDFEDENLRNEMKAILLAHGWTDQRNPAHQRAGSKKLSKPLGFKTRLKGALPKRLWPFLSKYLAIRPPEIDGLNFKSSEQALAYALRFPRHPCASLPWQESLLEYKQIELT